MRLAFDTRHALHALLLILLVLVTLLSACTKGSRIHGNRQPRLLKADDRSISAAELLPATARGLGFSKIEAAETGIDFSNKVSDESLILEEIFTQSGMASGDYDGDGDLDLYLCSINGPNRLYRNDSGMHFSDVTAASGSGLDGADYLGSGGVFSDLNADGRLDLYVCNRRGPNQLFIQQADGTFKDEAAGRGCASERSTVMSAVFDADNDGDLDMYLANYRQSNDTSALLRAYAEGRLGGIKPWYMVELTRGRLQTGELPAAQRRLPADLEQDFYVDGSGFAHLKPQVNELLLNDGHGRFSDHTAAAGMDLPAWSFQPQACDFNDDGFIDIYVSSDFEFPDRLWMNNGDGTFTNRASEMTRKSPLLSMGADSGDLNGDGLMDLFTSDMLSPDYKRAKRQSGEMSQWRYELINGQPQPQMRNMLFLNRGGGWMTELGQFAGVSATDWTWSARIADLNLDGSPELFVTNGNLHDTQDVDSQHERMRMAAAGEPLRAMKDYFLGLPDYLTDDVLFSADSPLKYKPAADNWGIHDHSMGCGCSIADYDGDGDPDIIVNNTNAPLGVYRNDMETGAAVLIDLKQDGDNPAAIGARVSAQCGTQQYCADVILARGFATGESGRICLGLGSAEKIDRLSIRWPDMQVQVYADLPVGRHYTISRARRTSPAPGPAAAALFTQLSLPFRQTEQDTLPAEYQHEPLLPLQQSTLGTGLAVADFTGDGGLDIYCGGAAGQQGALLGSEAGKPGAAPEFVTRSEQLEGLDLDTDVEEMSALCLDADASGSADLLLTAGGIEGHPGGRDMRSSLLISREGSFSRLPLPRHSGGLGSACAADIDHDGDLDVFLAGHLQPWHFAATAGSELWLNEQGAFRAALAELCPALQAEPETAGQISEAQFADLNGDGWQDLVLARTWGSLEWLPNEQGHFSRMVALSRSGWWHSLGLADFDNDGDIDLIAGNCGENTKYHPKDGQPVTLFAGDFDNNGSRDLIEVKFRSDGCMLPGRGRSCSGYAVGYIPQKFPTWTSFANATLEDVYGPGLASAQRYEAATLSHVVGLNDGSGNFSLSELPLPAQLAPVFGIACGDFNNDGNLDAWLGNNFTATQPETGNWSTGYGTLLLGDGHGAFHSLEAHESGSYVWQDARSAIAADLNADGALDIAVSCSNANAQLLLGRAGQGDYLSIELAGRPPNSSAVGSRLRLSLSDGRTLTRCVQAGQGYLGSYRGPVHFGYPQGVTAQKLEIVWPDGSSESISSFSGKEVKLEQK